MKKRLMSIATALALCLSLLPTAAFAESHTCVDGDGDHDCDECYETISDCVDEDHDHWCDICGEVTYRTDPLDSGYYVCEAGCGAVEVNVTGEYTELNYHGMEEGTLADGTVEISVCIPNYEQFYGGVEYDLVKNGTVTVFWTDEEGSVFDTHTVEDVELVDGKATVSFTDLPIEILHRGHLIYKPADPTMYLPASNGLILKYQENVHRLSVDSNVDCTINGVYEDDLYLFAGTEVTLIALGDFRGQLTWTYDENSAQPEYKVMGSIVTFTMPEDDVYADMEYVCVVEYVPAASGFTDVAEESYYYDAVNWAVAKGITSGTSATTFSPDAPCTRAQMATFLWRAAGSPEPKDISNSFTDVAADAYYAKAVQWAVEQGITTGTSATTFSPDAACTRAQMATFIYRCEQANGGGFTGAWMFLLPFNDAPKWAYEPIAWCYKKGITSGTSATTFSPDAPCTRAQMMTFLYRFFVG